MTPKYNSFVLPIPLCPAIKNQIDERAFAALDMSPLGHSQISSTFCRCDAQIKQDESPVSNAQLGVSARNVRIIEDQLIIEPATNVNHRSVQRVVAASVHNQEGAVRQRTRPKYGFALHGMCEFKRIATMPCDNPHFPALQGRISGDGDVELTLNDVTN